MLRRPVETTSKSGQRTFGSQPHKIEFSHLNDNLVVLAVNPPNFRHDDDAIEMGREVWSERQFKSSGWPLGEKDDPCQTGL